MPKKKLPPQEALTLALHDLERSDLDESDKDALGMIALSAAETKALHPSFKDIPSLLIPYYDPWTGRPFINHPGAEPYSRIRYLKEQTDLVSVATGKSQRYAQAPGTGLAAYFPTNVTNWPEILKDVRYPIHLAEGEKKAACACKHGYPCIGLGGVWSFMSGKEGLDFLPELQQINWCRRKVYIDFDSDARTKPGVCKAANVLAERLAALGAYVYFVEMPEVVAGGKSGLDDVLKSMADKRDFNQVLLQAKMLSITKALWEMNDELVFVRDINQVMERKTNLKMRPEAFTKSLYANATVFESEINDDGTVTMKRVNAADRWMKFPWRCDATGLAYAPGSPQGFINGSGYYNTWPGWGAEPVKGDVSLFLRLVDQLFEGQPIAKRYFLQWCAWPLQHPGDKMYVCAAFYSLSHGLGKSLLAFILGAIYGKNFTAIKERDLTNTFNPWAEGCQLLLIDDVTGSDNRAHADMIKGIITQHDAMVNIKFVSQYKVRDCCNIILTSNNPTAYYLEGDDRRYFVFEVTCNPLPDKFYQELDYALKEEPTHKFASAVHYYLLHEIDCSDFNPHARALLTQAKADMIEEVKTDLASWCDRLKADPDHALLENMPSLQKNGSVQGDLFTNAELFKFYDPDKKTRDTPNSLGRALTRAGIRRVNGSVPVRTVRGPQRYYAIRNVEKWLAAKPDLLTKYINTLYGEGGTK